MKKWCLFLGFLALLILPDIGEAAGRGGLFARFRARRAARQAAAVYAAPAAVYAAPAVRFRVRARVYVPQFQAAYAAPAAVGCYQAPVQQFYQPQAIYQQQVFQQQAFYQPQAIGVCPPAAQVGCYGGAAAVNPLLYSSGARLGFGARVGFGSRSGFGARVGFGSRSGFGARVGFGN